MSKSAILRVFLTDLIALDVASKRLRKDLADLQNQAREILDDLPVDPRHAQRDFEIMRLRTAILDHHTAGHLTVYSYVRMLNEKNIRTARGNPWTPVTLRPILDRIAKETDLPIAPRPQARPTKTRYRR